MGKTNLFKAWYARGGDYYDKRSGTFKPTDKKKPDKKKPDKKKPDRDPKKVAEDVVSTLLEDDEEKECAKCSQTPCTCPPIGKRGPYPPLMQ
jgi:hypothetical protein